MATNTLRDAGVVVLTTSIATLYTVPNDKNFTVSMLQICNTSGNHVTVNLCVVPPGAAHSQAYAVLWDFTVAANDALRLLQGDIWKEGAKLTGVAGTAGVLNVRLSGVESQVV